MAFLLKLKLPDSRVRDKFNLAFALGLYEGRTRASVNSRLNIRLG